MASSTRMAFAAALVLTMIGGVAAQTMTDGSQTEIGPADASTLLALIGRELRDPEARVANLHKGRAGAVCGAVDVRNRMGAYTGPRGFVADIAGGFFGRLPEDPEMRSPASMADYRAMERARAMFIANCVTQ